VTFNCIIDAAFHTNPSSSTRNLQLLQTRVTRLVFLTLTSCMTSLGVDKQTKRVKRKTGLIRTLRIYKKQNNGWILKKNWEKKFRRLCNFWGFLHECKSITMTMWKWVTLRLEHHWLTQQQTSGNSDCVNVVLSRLTTSVL